MKDDLPIRQAISATCFVCCKLVVCTESATYIDEAKHIEVLYVGTCLACGSQMRTTILNKALVDKMATIGPTLTHRDKAFIERFGLQAYDSLMKILNDEVKIKRLKDCVCKFKEPSITLPEKYEALARFEKEAKSLQSPDVKRIHTLIANQLIGMSMLINEIQSVMILNKIKGEVAFSELHTYKKCILSLARAFINER